MSKQTCFQLEKYMERFHADLVVAVNTYISYHKDLKEVPQEERGAILINGQHQGRGTKTH